MFQQQKEDPAKELAKREFIREILKELLNINEVARKISKKDESNPMYAQLIMHSCQVIKDMLMNMESALASKDKIRNLGYSPVFEAEAKTIIDKLGRLK